MSTGRNYDRVRDSTSLSQEKGPDFVQTVNPSDETHISSFVNRANQQIEAAIAYLIKDYEGIEINEQGLADLSARIKGIISQTFAGEAEILPATDLPVFVQFPDLLACCLSEQHDVDNLLKTIQSMRAAAENDPQFEADIYTFDRVAEALQWIVVAGRIAFVGRETGTIVLPAMQAPSRAESPANPKQDNFYDAVKHANNNPVTISSDCIFFSMLTTPENLASFIENISAWFAIWSNTEEKWAGNLRTSACDYSVIMEFLGRMVAAVAEHDAEESESEAELKAENAALLTERKWLAKTLDKSNANVETLKAGAEKINELQAEVDRLKAKYEPNGETKKGGSAK
ncbi:hypothetical protein [Larkinella terrae]|uniref:Uncharacterized protein n=1 Tax=Larkinella terrae TaxID=2025311 RepID=A0A7K0EIT4_9BACT|nr:hypothetical protein [Larkinella terrae]MRS61642.1 hypothetical protein [Larkinella terrae]